MRAVNWDKLKKIRGLYVGADQALRQDYWSSEALLADYDATFGRRIQWKWQAAVAGAVARGFDPRACDAVVDWGCGSGVALETMAAHLGADWEGHVLVVDRSALATRFAARKAASLLPRARVTVLSALSMLPTPRTMVLVSHVLTELDEKTLASLVAVLRDAAALLWVEPGTPFASRRLGGVRESLRNTLVPVAPCPQAGACGIFAPGNESHWCHGFAPVPDGILQDADWRTFADAMGVDLRSLPFSYVAMARGATPGPGARRMLGRPRIYKGYAKILACDAAGVREGRVQQRLDKAFFKRLDEADPDKALPDDLWEPPSDA